MKVDDGKHFLKVVLHDQSIRATIVCEADPANNRDAQCHIFAHNPTDSRSICIIQDSWSYLGLDMLAKAPSVDDKVGLTIDQYPIPIIYESDGVGEDYEDWVIPKVVADVAGD